MIDAPITPPIDAPAQVISIRSAYWSSAAIAVAVFRSGQADCHVQLRPAFVEFGVRTDSGRQVKMLRLDPGAGTILTNDCGIANSTIQTLFAGQESVPARSAPTIPGALDRAQDSLPCGTAERGNPQGGEDPLHKAEASRRAASNASRARSASAAAWSRGRAAAEPFALRAPGVLRPGGPQRGRRSPKGEGARRPGPGSANGGTRTPSRQHETTNGRVALQQSRRVIYSPHPAWSALIGADPVCGGKTLPRLIGG